jgi:hypothetical protein
MYHGCQHYRSRRYAEAGAADLPYQRNYEQQSYQAIDHRWDAHQKLYGRPEDSAHLERSYLG